MDQKLQEKLDGLTAEGLEEALRYIEYRYSRASAGDVTPEDFRYWQSICTAIGGGWSSDQQTLSNFLLRKGGYGVRRYRSAVACLKNYVTTSKVNLSRAEHMKIVTACLEAIVARLEHLNLPKTPQIILDHALSSLDDAVQWHYPGYKRADMLHMIAKGLRT